MDFFRTILLPLCAFCLCVEISAADRGDTLELPDDKNNVILRQTPMPEVGVGRLADILSRYYQEGLGGADNWEEISSLKIFGTIKVEDGELELKAYQKKPNLIKMTLTTEDDKDIVLVHDGEVAWQLLPNRGAKPTQMEAREARRFKHNSHFGNHLLYPYAEGKEISYIDTVPVDGNICHQIRVVLDTQFQVDYFIDIRTYLEIKVVSTDLTDRTTNTAIYKDYIREYGMPIAKQIESYENGEWVSSLTLDEVQVNAGIMPWMFKMPK